MKYRYLILAIICCFFIETVSANKRIVIGVERLGYLPYYNVDIEGEYVGFARELFDAFQQHSKYLVIYKDYSIPILYEDFFKEKIDAKFPDHPKWIAKQRDGKEIFYSNKIVKFTDGVTKLVGFKNKVNRVSIVRGFTPWMLLSTEGNYEFIEVTNLASAIKMVLKKKVDGVYGNVHVVRHNYEQLGYKAFGEELTLDRNIPFETDYYYLSSITSKELIDDFNKFLSETKSLGNLLKKHKLND